MTIKYIKRHLIPTLVNEINVPVFPGVLTNIISNNKIPGNNYSYVLPKCIDEMSKAPELNFKGGNPGAVQYGNFINYYQFHPPENRLKLLPTDIWPKNKEFYALDLGSNAGDLTISLHNFLREQDCLCSVLGVEIDPTLVERAREKIQNTESIHFYCLDFMNKDSRGLIKDYLKKRKLIKFDAIFCFSITMWIHLNYGDAGLEEFLKNICELTDLVVIEPQPWKCYKTAEKRMKLNNAEFPYFKELKIRQTVEKEIDNFLKDKCGMTQIYQSSLTEWGRRLFIYKHLPDT